MADDQPFYSPNRPLPGRMPSPGFKLWELRQGDRLLTCELRDDGKAAAGLDVQLLEDGELLVSQRCFTAESVRYVAQSFKNDHLRTGWTTI